MPPRKNKKNMSQVILMEHTFINSSILNNKSFFVKKKKGLGIVSVTYFFFLLRSRESQCSMLCGMLNKCGKGKE
jgi:hypothetical protein